VLFPAAEDISKLQKERKLINNSKSTQLLIELLVLILLASTVTNLLMSKVTSSTSHSFLISCDDSH